MKKWAWWTLGLTAAAGAGLYLVLRPQDAQAAQEPIQVPQLDLSRWLDYQPPDTYAGQVLQVKRMAVDQSGLPRGVRNNNPGNVRDTGDHWEGMVGVDKDGFIIFSSVVYGLRCLVKVLHKYFERGENSLQQIISKYAPKKENDTGAYVRYLAGALNVSATAPLDWTTYGQNLVFKIASYEQGGQLTKWWSQDQLAQGYQVGAESVGVA